MGNRINYKIFFDTFADEKEVKVPKENRKHIVVVPLNDRPLWEDQAEFKKFVEEWLHYDKSIDNVRILTDYSRKPKLYYGDILIVDDNVALSFDLYEKYDASHSNGNLGILMLSTGDILREYSKIFSDEYYKELSTPEEYYELLNNK